MSAMLAALTRGPGSTAPDETSLEATRKQLAESSTALLKLERQRKRLQEALAEEDGLLCDDGDIRVDAATIERCAQVEELLRQAA